MRKFLLFGSGAAVGYMAGAKAGRQRYDQILKAVTYLGDRSGLWARIAPPVPSSDQRPDQQATRDPDGTGQFGAPTDSPDRPVGALATERADRNGLMAGEVGVL